jgi:hypothetical protein
LTEQNVVYKKTIPKTIPKPLLKKFETLDTYILLTFLEVENKQRYHLGGDCSIQLSYGCKIDFSKQIDYITSKKNIQ